MELFHLKTPYLDCPQCFFYNSRALSGTLYIGIAKQEPEGAEPLMDVTENLSDEVPLGCIAVKDYSENTGLLAFLNSTGDLVVASSRKWWRSAAVDMLRSRSAAMTKLSWRDTPGQPGGKVWEQIQITPARSASHPALRSRWLPDSSNSWTFGI